MVVNQGCVKSERLECGWASWGVSRKPFREVIVELRSEWKGASYLQIWRTSVIGTRNSKCKNPEAKRSLICFRNRKKVCVADI